MAVLMLSAVIVPVMLTQRQADAWWNSSWTARRKITLNNSASAENLVDFPIRVSLTSSNIDYTKTKDAGEDIRFVDSNDTTALSYEIEKWDEAGTSEIWVKVPQIDANSSTDFIYVYYNNTAATDGQSPTGVWDSAHKGVWHSQQISGTSLADSTSNANTGTKPASTRPNPTAGKIDGAQEYELSTSDYVDVSTAAADVASGSLTYSTWFKPQTTFTSANSTDQMLISIGDAPSTNDVNLLLEEATGSMEINTYNGTTGYDAATSQTSWTGGTWYHIAATFNTANGAVAIYVNGALSGSTTSTSPYRGGVDSASMSLGRLYNNTLLYDGTLDEVRVANTARSADWVEADYISQNNAMNSFGSEETSGGGGGPSAGWLNSCYQSRRQITFNNAASSENLVDFPVRVSLTSSNIDYNKVKANGEDIRFSDSDGTTNLNFEIEDWIEGGTSEVWVKVPQIDAASTTDSIFIYYNCSSATDGQNVAATWNSGYRNVYHMKGTNGSATVPDSATANTTENITKISGAGTGSPVNVTTGKIGPAQSFDRAASSEATIAGLQGSPTDITLSGWGNLTTGDTFSSDFINIGDRVYLRIDQSSTNTRGGWYDTGGVRELFTNTTYAGTGWHYFALTVNATGDVQHLVIDGVSVASSSFTNAISYGGGGSDTLLGRHAVNAGDPRYWDGPMDELRFSSVARSVEWLEAEYVSTNNAMNTFGSEQNFRPDAPTLSLPVNSATQVSRYPQFNLRASDPRNPTYLQYKIEVCANSDCSSLVRTIDQTSTQTGWSGQDTQAGAGYTASATLASSTMAVHTYQAAPLAHSTQYWWRAYAIDPDNSNSFSDASVIFSFTTETPPPPPVLESPANGETGVSITSPFRLRSTDVNSDYLQYRIEVCATSNCSSVIRTIDQTLSQTGWQSQGAAGGTGYYAAPLVGDSQMAIHTYQAPLLAVNTQYWWRAYAIDPGGTNVFSSASAINTFTTGVPKVELQGGTEIRGGTTIGQ